MGDVLMLKKSFFQNLRDLFLKAEDDPPTDPPADPPKKEKSKEARPAWVNEILDALKGTTQPQQGTQEVPVPPAPQAEQPEEEEMPRESKTKKIMNWLF